METEVERGGGREREGETETVREIHGKKDT